MSYMALFTIFGLNWFLILSMIFLSKLALFAQSNKHFFLNLIMQHQLYKNVVLCFFLPCKYNCLK
jgi:hypothetical protein